MAAELPYLASYKNVSVLFEKILTAKQPDAFTLKFLYETIGLKSIPDRQLISLLKTLGFLDPSGRPTQSYAKLKNNSEAPFAIAAAVHKAYEPLFAANENANELSGDALKGLVAQVAGTDAGITAKITGTFNALVKNSNFSRPPASLSSAEKNKKEKEKSGIQELDKGSFRPEFHYNIQIHLPSNGTEETYLNIFNAVRKVFK